MGRDKELVPAGAGSQFCPTFSPTKEQFSKPFCDYVKGIFRKNPGLAMFKVQPPRGWKPRRAAPDLSRIEIQTPIKQMVFGTRGAYRCLLIEQKGMTAAEFRAHAELPEHLPGSNHHRGEVRKGSRPGPQAPRQVLAPGQAPQAAWHAPAPPARQVAPRQTAPRAPRAPAPAAQDPAACLVAGGRPDGALLLERRDHQPAAVRRRHAALAV
jgi:hypothetical protein